jgi:soluble lytic murein transglycosylase
MSSMVKRPMIFALLASAGLIAPLAAEAAAPDENAWDRARAALRAQGPTNWAYAVDRWRQLSASNRFAFGDYATFLAGAPGFPEEDKLRRYAESALDREYVDPARVVAFFDRFPPLTNPGRAQYALALAAMRRPEAETVARAAWRGGPMSDTAEATLFSRFYAGFGADDHDARMDALLWAGAQAQAERQIAYVSPGRRAIDGARLASLRGLDPEPIAATVSSASLMTDPGYVFQRARQLRRNGSPGSARALLANSPPLARRPADAEKWVEELLVNARGAAADGDSRTAVRIAKSVDQAFDPGANLSAMSLGLRDDYTSLVWLGGTQALWNLRDYSAAAPLFYKYGAAAKTPQTRSKGFYWAGLAATHARDNAGAHLYFAIGG